mmetsp:Transcript_108602/g.187836  ORF Transcript_108602/g.187836 Transcript_108602/m.187836 type:complete len:319 (+) Transcript_108602:3752-4708(+)
MQFHELDEVAATQINVHLSLCMTDGSILDGVLRAEVRSVLIRFHQTTDTASGGASTQVLQNNEVKFVGQMQVGGSIGGLGQDHNSHEMALRHLQLISFRVILGLLLRLHLLSGRFHICDGLCIRNGDGAPWGLGNIHVQGEALVGINSLGLLEIRSNDNSGETLCNFCDKAVNLVVGERVHTAETLSKTGRWWPVGRPLGHHRRHGAWRNWPHLWAHRRESGAGHGPGHHNLSLATTSWDAHLHLPSPATLASSCLGSSSGSHLTLASSTSRLALLSTSDTLRALLVLHLLLHQHLLLGLHDHLLLLLLLLLNDLLLL